MRVAYDHQVTSLQDAGGLSRYFFELAQALLHVGEVNPDFILGLEQSVVSFRSLRPPARVLAIRSGMKPGYQRYALNEALTAVLAPLRGRYDVYHATYQRILPYVRRRAVVVTHHDSTPERYPHLFPDAMQIHGRLEKLYASADRIICISESSRQDLLHYHRVDPAKTDVIHHGFTRLGSAAAETAPDYFGGRPFLLYVGARSAYKNFPIVLKALAQQVESLCLLVMGGGAFSGEETQRVENLGLAGRVKLCTRPTDAQLAAAYRSATLFIYPSLYEGFGFPPLEAMDAGCPALVSRASALPEVCGEAAFYFDPESLEELSQLIRTLLEDTDLRSSKQQAGVTQVSRYSWDKAAMATLRAYRKAVQEA
jgi:glycosyltransferase involved in cell wall biosynthesis